jgi:hypothetical protein
MSTDKQQMIVGQELVERLQINKMLDAIRSAEVDELELPEINEQNKSTVEPKKLPKNETNP